ncbi:MAG: hypothetical protein H8K03_13715 [Nitrospira sp.]|jgi:hypothetical protein|nr:hypothetical protein [Nitrospira sp. BO4]
MPNTVRGFFHTLAHAEQTKFEIATLKQIPTIDMQVYDQTGVQLTAGTAASPNSSFESLKDSLGFGPLSLPLYPEGVRRGGPVLDIQADDRHIDAIADVLDRCGAEDISIFTAAERK